MASQPDSSPKAHASFGEACAHALPVTALVLALLTYWFAAADRYIVFLYHHDMGPLYPDTSPFSKVTSSRYWMTGLVATGAVLVLYTAANWVLGRLFARYRPPDWWRVWSVCAIPLLVSVPLITMTANQPTLSPRHAARVTLATLVGLALALIPGKVAAARPAELAWLASDGWGMMWLMLNVIHVEKVRRWLARDATLWVWMMVAGITIGGVWLLVMTALRVWRRRRTPGVSALVVAGLCVAYLVMPLVHHVIGTDGYFYISDSDNFFAQSPLVQIAAWLVMAALALGITRLRQSLARKVAAQRKS